MWPPFVFTSPELSPPGVGAADHTAGVIQVPYTGMYRVTIYGMAHTSLSVSVFLAYMNLSVNNVSQFAPHLHAHKSLGTIDFGFMTLLSLNEGDEVALAPQRGATYCANRYTNTLLHIEFVK
jgi:hypothetical protein